MKRYPEAPDGLSQETYLEAHAKFTALRLVSQLPHLHDYVLRCRLAGTSWREIMDRLEAMMAD